MDRKAAIEALQWHIDAGADELLLDEPVDATAMPALPAAEDAPPATAGVTTPDAARTGAAPPTQGGSAPLLGASEARKESLRLAIGQCALCVKRRYHCPSRRLDKSGISPDRQFFG